VLEGDWEVVQRQKGHLKLWKQRAPRHRGRRESWGVETEGVRLERKQRLNDEGLLMPW
jgi:hypothetical protein